MTLRWAQAQQVVPTQSIRQILHGAELPVEGRTCSTGAALPAHGAGPAELGTCGIAPGAVNLCAHLAPPRGMQQSRRNTGVYAPSPADPQALSIVRASRSAIACATPIEAGAHAAGFGWQHLCA